MSDAILLFFAPLLSAATAAPCTDVGSDNVEFLVALSQRRMISLSDSSRELLDVRDLPHALKRVDRHPDISSIHLLMLLRRQHPESYAQISADKKARILLACLNVAECADDWSFLESS